MQTWWSFCQRSIVFKAYSKHFKRGTPTTKQHSYHRYHSRKRALAQCKHREPHWSHQQVYIFLTAHTAVLKADLNSAEQADTSRGSFWEGNIVSLAMLQALSWLVAVLKPMHISVLCLPGMALDQNEKLVTQCHSCCHISDTYKLVPSFTQHPNKVYMCFSPLHFHAYRRALFDNKHNKLWWDLLSQKTPLPSKEHMN